MAKRIISRRKTASKKPAGKPVREQINNERGRLFQAQAVINCARFAVSTKCAGLGDTDISIALHVADKIIDDVCAALELVGVQS